MNSEKQTLSKKLSLFAITWPIFVEMLLFMLMGSADTFMLSKISDDSVASVGVANQLISIAIIMFGFVGTGTAVVIAQYLGADKYAQASKVAATAITLNLIFGIFISIIYIIFKETGLRMMNIPEALLADAEMYMLIVGGTLFVQALLVTVSSVLRSNGFTRDAMFVSLGMNLINVAGNYLFIYGAFGFPVLGVQGVALSTAVSRTIGLILLFVLMYRRLKVAIPWRDYFIISKSYCYKILRIGLPSAGEHLSYNTSQIMITYFITALGTAALATRIYTINIMFFVLLFGFAMGQGTQIIVGHMIGAKKTEEAYNQLLRSLRWSLIITVGVVLAMVTVREPLLGIFTKDPEIISVGSMLLLSCILLEPGRTFNLVVINSLRAAGDANFPVIMGVISMWGIAVPLSYLLGIHWGFGLLGVWIALAVDEWLRGLCMYFRWRGRKWEKMSLVEQEANEREEVISLSQPTTPTTS
jgi:putative MATE family efflux protein